MPIHNIYKPLGWSPLDAVSEFRKRFPEHKDAPITYAGRLDPMAEGVLILLSGEERFEKPAFQKLNKTYKATFLFGVSSDTYDSLGLVTRSKITQVVSSDQITDTLLGTHNLPFPPYSSYRIKGKPLHYWALQGKLDEVEIPEKEMTVLNISHVKISKRSIDEIKQDVFNRIDQVKGDFRQDQIIEQWGQLEVNKTLSLAHCMLTVTSGTYIRSLAHEMGHSLGGGALLLSLMRTSVGEYEVEDSVRF